MNSNTKRNNNLRVSLDNIEKVLIDAHNSRVNYSKGQINALNTLKDTFSERLSEIEKSEAA